jgi:hypothetical protein
VKGKIIAPIALVGGPIIAWFGFAEKAQLERLAKEGKEIVGSIEGGEIKKGRRGVKTYKLDVIYAVENGQQYQQTFKVTKDFCRSVTDAEGTSLTQTDAKVRYLPTEPLTAIIVDGSKDDTARSWIGVAVGLGGLVGSVLAFRRSAAVPTGGTPPPMPPLTPPTAR